MWIKVVSLEFCYYMSFDDENNSRIDMTMIIDDDDGHGVEIFWWDGLVKFGI